MIKNMKLIDFLYQLSKFLLVMVVGLVPIASIYGSFDHKLGLTALLYLIVIERIWFSLFTTKEGKAQKYKTTDWTLILVTYAYLAFVSALFYELSQGHYQITWTEVILGFLLMFISYFVRNWSVYHLGEQWASHLETADNVGRQLIRSGPYAFMRHPIYTAAIVEFLGMQFLFGDNHSLPFLTWIGIPSIILRALYEEKIAGVVFGKEYEKYMDETGRFLPHFKKNYREKKRLV